MKTFNFFHSTTDQTELFFRENNFEIEEKNALSILIQVFCGSLLYSDYENILGFYSHRFPKAVIIGTTSIGEISQGNIEVKNTCISISFFRETKLKGFFYEIFPGNEFDIGRQIVKENTCSDSQGILMFATGKGIKSYNLLNGINSLRTDLVIAGGHAAIEEIFVTWIFNGKIIHNCGITGVVFDNPTLIIHNNWHLSWQPIGKEMTITKSDGLNVYEIDGIPAYQIYKKYFGNKIEESFNLNAIEFPLITKRENVDVARVAVFRNNLDDSLVFYAELNEGEKVRLGFGNIHIILDSTWEILEKVSQHPVEGCFIFSCGIRRSFMQKDIALEVAPFQNIAPTCGFFTWGEFYGDRAPGQLLNSTLTILTLAEAQSENNSLPKTFERPDIKDEMGYKYASVLENLAYLANTVTAELEEQTEHLKKTNETKDRLFSIIAHDLRGPFNVLMGLTQVMIMNIDKYSAERLKDLLIKLNTCSRTAYTLTDNLLNWALEQTGNLKYYPQYFNFNDIVAAEIDNLKEFANTKNVEIKLIGEMDSIVYADINMQKFIFRNLLNNAVKYTNRGGNIMVVVTGIFNYIEVAVIDNGIGMEPDEVETILSEGSKFSTPGTEQEKGTGLGLMLCKEFIALNKGTLAVKSEKDKGSEFKYSIPVNEEE